MKTFLTIICSVLLLFGSGCSRDGKNSSEVRSLQTSSDSAFHAGTTDRTTETPQVLEILQRARKAISNIEQPSDRAVLVAEVAVALAKSGDSILSANLFQSAIEIADTIDDSETSNAFAIRIVTSSSLGPSEPIILGTIARSQTKSGDFKGALRTARRVKDLDWQDITLGEIVRALVEADKLKEAYETCLTVNGDFWKAKALLAVASAYRKAGNSEAAFMLLKKAQPAASAVDADYSENANIFWEVGDAHGRAGHVSEMLQWADELTSAKGTGRRVPGTRRGAPERGLIICDCL